MIPKQHYLPHSKHLAVGQQININHSNCDAGTDTKRRLYIKRKDDDTILAYCHNCGDYGVHSNRGRVKAIRELLAENTYIQKNEAGELVLPPDVQRIPETWPVEARAWVYKYGITRDEILVNELCYSPSWDRVILPTYEDGKLAHWQGRAVRPLQEPKYINAKAHPKVMAWHRSSERANRGKVFIVEDRLSGIKLGRYVDTVALLGTSGDFHDLTESLKHYKAVGILLDPDQAGNQKSRELYQRLSLSFHGTVKKLVANPNQPKEMDDPTLRAIAGGL